MPAIAQHALCSVDEAVLVEQAVLQLPLVMAICQEWVAYHGDLEKAVSGLTKDDISDGLSGVIVLIGSLTVLCVTLVVPLGLSSRKRNATLSHMKFALLLPCASHVAPLPGHAEHWVPRESFGYRGASCPRGTRWSSSVPAAAAERTLTVAPGRCGGFAAAQL